MLQKLIERCSVVGSLDSAIVYIMFIFTAFQKFPTYTSGRVVPKCTLHLLCLPTFMYFSQAHGFADLGQRSKSRWPTAQKNVSSRFIDTSWYLHYHCVYRSKLDYAHTDARRYKIDCESVTNSAIEYFAQELGVVGNEIKIGISWDAFLKT